MIIASSSTFVGYQLAKAKYVGEKVKALQDLIEQQEQIAQENSEINDSVQEDLEQISHKERKVIEKVIKYVEVHPDTTNCKLDATGLQLWNSASEE